MGALNHAVAVAAGNPIHGRGDLIWMINGYAPDRGAPACSRAAAGVDSSEPGRAPRATPSRGPTGRTRGWLLVATVWAATACGDGTVRPPDRPEGETLSGQVRQVATEVLIEDVNVVVDDQTTRTTPNGRYAFEGLEAGEVMLTATFPGFEVYERRVRIREGSNTHDIAMIPVVPQLRSDGSR